MTRPTHIEDPVARRTQALADATRRRLLDELRREPCDVRDLAVRVGLHPNAVRQHLAVLHGAALVVEEIDRARRTGRPRRLYHAAERADLATVFAEVAGLLAEVAAGGDTSVIGEARGAALAAASSARDATEVLADIAAHTGFAVTVDARPDGTRLALGACPFAAFAGPVVCGLHRAIVDGAARHAGASLTDFTIVDPHDGPCVVTINTEGAS